MEQMRLVLLPGMDGTGELFKPLLEALPLSLKVEVISFPVDRAMSYAELEQLILSRLPGSEFVVLGESFSGPLAIAVAAMRPPGLRGILLCCTFAQNPRPGLAIFGRLLGIRAALRIAPHRLVALIGPFLLGSFANKTLSVMLENALRQVKPEVMLKRAQEVLLVDMREKLASIPIPVMYLQALQDRVVPAKVADTMIQIQPAMEIARIEGPHCLLQAQPLLCARAIEEFCARMKVATQ